MKKKKDKKTKAASKTDNRSASQKQNFEIAIFSYNVSYKF